MNRIEEYVERSFMGIPDSEQKEQLKQDILQNLHEKVHALMQHGKTQEDAENKAIVDFGDMEDIKQELGICSTARSPLNDKKIACWHQLWFSAGGSILIISLVLFINLYYTPTILWFVYPLFGVLWWPLAMFFRWLKYK